MDKFKRIEKYHVFDSDDEFENDIKACVVIFESDNGLFLADIIFQMSKLHTGIIGVDVKHFIDKDREQAESAAIDWCKKNICPKSVWKTVPFEHEQTNI